MWESRERQSPDWRGDSRQSGDWRSRGADRSELNPPIWFITGVLATHRLDRSEAGAV